MATLRKRMDPRVPRRARPREEQRIDAFLKNVQDALMAQHAAQIVAINTENGEYAVGATFHEACEGFRARWRMARCTFAESMVDLACGFAVDHDAQNSQPVTQATKRRK